MPVSDPDDTYFKISRPSLIIPCNLVLAKIIFFSSKVHVPCWYTDLLSLHYTILGIAKERWCYEVSQVWSCCSEEGWMWLDKVFHM